jgi:hypothetical protein
MDHNQWCGAGPFLCGSDSGSRSDHFFSTIFLIPVYLRNKFKSFQGLKKFSCFLKTQMIIKMLFKLNSYKKNNFLTSNFSTGMKNLGLLVGNILYEFTYPQPEPAQKTSAPAPSPA